jgi:hypothetical protein
VHAVSSTDLLEDFELLIGKTVAGWAVRDASATTTDEAGVLVVDLVLRMVSQDQPDGIEVTAVFALDAHVRHGRDPSWILQALALEVPLQARRLYSMGWR